MTSLAEEAKPTAWSAGAQDWADVMEGWNGWGVPVYRHVLSLVPALDGARILDVGCGAGRFCRLAADRGADVSGLDATPEFTEIARSRVLGADIRVGGMERLPWEDDSFDLVTGFNSFFLAEDPVKALREAARVTRPGGHVATTTFGHPESCDSTRVFATLSTLKEPTEQAEEAAASSAAQPSPSDQGVLEGWAEQAGLTVVAADYLRFTEEYEDVATVVRGMTAAPPFRHAAADVGEERVRAVVTEALEALQSPDGRCRLNEECRYLVAVA
ncbi:MAG: class I SAM-dependent methyltransferase [Actinomycetota bacterium]|nr:class I SAM-dependent methyltransferase [Actinomycetota bacterium]